MIIEKLGWKFFIGIRRKNMCISRGNIIINPLSHKDFVHLSEAGLPEWVFDQLASSGGYG